MYLIPLFSDTPYQEHHPSPHPTREGSNSMQVSRGAGWANSESLLDKFRKKKTQK